VSDADAPRTGGEYDKAPVILSEAVFAERSVWATPADTIFAGWAGFLIWAAPSCGYHRDMAGEQENDVSIFILAGGKSTRMGQDKAFVKFQGRAFLSRALDLARSITSNVSIVGSREKFAAYAPVVEDTFRDCGPLGGIHAALLSSQSDLNLMLAVDMPFVTHAFLQYLITAAKHACQDVAVVPRSGGRLQPLCAVYRPEFAREAEKSLGAGKNKIDPLFSIVSTRIIEEKELEAAGLSKSLFRNLNTLEEFAAAEDRN
jgi:molybdenum cofactor guanylyltransferase